MTDLHYASKRYALHYSHNMNADKQWWEDGGSYPALVVLAYGDSDMAPHWFITDRETGETQTIIQGGLPTEQTRRHYGRLLYGT